MYELHKDMPEVTILPPSTNIFHAIAVSDILVSEESSTMAEAVMMGVPAISVSDWLIPDVTPSRYPECSYTFVILTKKKELSACVKEILANYDKYKEETQKASAEHFSNVGKTSSIIMDIIDDCVANKQIRYAPITIERKEPVPFMKNIKHLLLQFRVAMFSNYSKRYKVIAVFWNGLKKAKNALVK